MKRTVDCHNGRDCRCAQKKKRIRVGNGSVVNKSANSTTTKKPPEQHQTKAKSETVSECTEKIPKSVVAAIVVERRRHSGVFLSRNMDDSIQLLTPNMATGGVAADYEEEQRFRADLRGESCEFRSWSPYHSTLAAAVMSGLPELYLKSGSKVLYLGTG
ncbi:rRNA 2'-O-methyltransferase fibrillarin [Drosophila guanche]|uniref:rRNA 2'-O-methyltransferase fibrillarin n=1 Tax=Drosophila guanche TaxID=7266 RepID=UPI0014716EDA|nr:rRNA 2'-O-methyltransferase fibrillarin [Drosophila guanche]